LGAGADVNRTSGNKWTSFSRSEPGRLGPGGEAAREALGVCGPRKESFSGWTSLVQASEAGKVTNAGGLQ